MKPLRIGQRTLRAVVVLFAVLAGLFEGAAAQIPVQEGTPDRSAEIEQHRRTVRLDPDNVQAWANLADIYGALQQYDEAVLALRELVRLQPENPRIRLLLGNALSESGDPDGAMLQYLGAIQLNPYAPEPHRNIGVLYFRKGDVDAAEPAFREALRLQPDYWLARLSWIEVLLTKNDTDAVLGLLRDAFRLDRQAYLANAFPNASPTEVEALQGATNEEAVVQFTLGGLLMAQRKDPVRAIRALEASVRSDPNFALPYQALAAAHAANNKSREAATAAERAIRLNPELPLAHLILAAVHSDEGRADAAIAELQTVLRLNPNILPAHALLANVYMRLSRFHDAIGAWEDVLALHPEAEQLNQAQMGLTAAYVATGQFPLAWQQIRELQSRGASLPPPLVNMLNEGFPESRFIELEEEAAQLRNAAQENPDDAETHMKLATSLAVLGEMEEAIPEYEAVVRLAPPGQAALLNSAHMGLSSVYEKLGRSRESLEQIELAIQADPSDAGSWNNAAWAYATSSDSSLRDPEKALQYGTKAVELSQAREPMFLDTLAEAYYVNEQFDEAIETIKKAVSLNRDNAYYKNQQDKFEQARRESRRRR